MADPRGRWSVAAARVLRIVPRADWQLPTRDVLAAIGAPGDAGRVMILRDGAGELAVLASGAIDIADVDPADVLPLPDPLATPELAAIVVWPDHSLSLLLQPSAEEPCPSRS